LAARIRLQRAGRKKRPFYRIVVADRAANRDGRFVERLGHYDPVPAELELVLNEERALYWLNMGAEPSDTVRSLMRRTGVWAKYKGVETAPPALSADEPEAAEAVEEAAPTVVADAPDDASDEAEVGDDAAEE
jgi:small subunit ribosomal protein S16